MTSTSLTLWKRLRETFACLVGIVIVMLGFGVFPYGKALVDRTHRAIGDWIISCNGGPPEKSELVLLGIDDASMSLDGLSAPEIAASPGGKCC